MTPQKWFAILASIAAGLLLTLIIQFNSGLGQAIGVVEATFVAHLAGAILGFVLLFFRLSRGLFQQCRKTPKYLYLGGVFGVVVTIIANTTTAQLGIALYSALITTFDLAASTTIDHFGLFGLQRFPITFQRIAGLCIALIGVACILGVKPW